MLIFARVLPLIRARVDANLRRHSLPREQVLAAVVRLLELTPASRRQRWICQGE
jgi:DNA topoisomerase-1